MDNNKYTDKDRDRVTYRDENTFTDTAMIRKTDADMEYNTDKDPDDPSIYLIILPTVQSI